MAQRFLWLQSMPSQIISAAIIFSCLAAHPALASDGNKGLPLVVAADIPAMASNKIDGEPAINKASRELLMPVATSADHGGANATNACASCHYGGKGKLQLGDRSALGEDDPEEFIETTLFGIAPEFGESGLEMPGFARSFSDAEVAQLAAHMRATLTTKAPWTDLEAAITKQRAKGAED